MTSISISPIATIATPYKQKFAIPRQPGLAKAKGKIQFIGEYDNADMLEGLEGYSHLWVLFQFHQTVERGWKAKVKTPRLGGNKTMGVLATRSTHRPNGIGMSVVENLGVAKVGGNTVLEVSGVDLLDGTPILDIKPYLPYADSVPNAHAAIETINTIPEREVRFTSLADAQVEQFSDQDANVAQLIHAVLRQDPRPAYKQRIDDDPKHYRVQLYNFDVEWRVEYGCIVVLALHSLDEKSPN